MSKTFEYADGGRAERFDTATGRCAAWSKEDLDYTILAFCTNHSAQEASTIFYRVCKVTHPSQIPPYAYGAVIAMMAEVLTRRPYRNEVTERLRRPQRKDNA